MMNKLNWQTFANIPYTTFDFRKTFSTKQENLINCCRQATFIHMFNEHCSIVIDSINTFNIT